VLSARGQGLELIGLSKRYGETQALREVSLRAAPGEILGIAGPNGAGKSTLIRMIAGEEVPDGGSVLLDGRPLSPAEASQAVSVVHQEVLLFPNLTVGENLLVGSGHATSYRRPVPGERHLAVLAGLGIRQFANTELARTSLVIRQLTEIARSLVREDESKVFLFDEPNSALTADESARLFSHIHELKEAGCVVLLVSHRLSELEAHADRVIVIRDGRVGAVLEGNELTERRIAHELVVGEQRLTEEAPGQPEGAAAAGGVVLRVSDWSHARGVFSGVDAEIRAGDVLAVVGVEGSGARELVRSWAGFEPAGGQLTLPGSPPGAGVARLTSYLPAAREASLFPNFSVGENLVSRLGSPVIATAWGGMRKRGMAQTAQDMITRFAVRARSPAQLVGTLSGGNQQKVAIAAAIAPRPRVLVAEEPTRGVDIGSKAEIYRALLGFAGQGGAVLVFCTEIPEVVELANRLLVMDSGRVVAELDVTAYGDVTSLAHAVATSRPEQPCPST
jgi:ABC-type sugar transport system ATPase subunit